MIGGIKYLVGIGWEEPFKGAGVYSAQEGARVGGRGHFGRLEARWDPFSKFNSENFLYRDYDRKVERLVVANESLHCMRCSYAPNL